MLLRHPISRRGFLLGTSLAASQAFPEPATSNPLPPPPDPGPEAIVPGPFVTQNFAEVVVDGVPVRLTFNQNVKVYRTADADGNHVFIQCEANSLTNTADSPAWAVIDSYGCNGMMRDPILQSSNHDPAWAQQGWDEMLATFPNKTAIVCRYDSRFNVSPSAQGKSVTYSAADLEAGFTLVKTLRTPGAHTNSHQKIRGYAHFHISNRPAPANAIPVGSSGPFNYVWNTSQINYSAFRSLAGLTSSMFMRTAQEQYDRCKPDIGVWGHRGDFNRGTRLDVHISSENYSADIIADYAQMLIHGHRADISPALRTQIAIRAIKWGLQVFSVADRGFSVRLGAGQGGNIGLWMSAAAALLNSPTLWHKSKHIRSQMVDVAHWCNDAMLSKPPVQQGNARNYQPALPNMVGIPFHFPQGYGTQVDAPYSMEGGAIVRWEAIASMLWQNAPGGEAGIHALLGGQIPNDTSQGRRSATIAWLDRHRGWVPWLLAARSNASWLPFYDVIRPLTTSVAPLWDGRHDQIHATSPNFVAGVGSVSWNVGSSYVYNNRNAWNRQDVRVSLLDGIQWVVHNNVSNPGSVSGLRQGWKHYGSMRRWNSKGVGEWSRNFPLRNDVSEVNFFTPTGTPPNAAINYAGGVLPAVHVDLYPGWTILNDRNGNPGVRYWVPAASTLAPDDIKLGAGLGYPSAGFPAPSSIAYQWQRSTGGTAWNDISGANRKEYVRTISDVNGAQLRCRITLTNTSGTTAVFTNAVTCPLLKTLPTNLHIETHFDQAFALDYHDVLQTLQVSGGTSIHDPFRSTFEVVVPFDATSASWFGDLEEESGSTGALGCHRTGRPSFIVDIAKKKPLTTGHTYILELDVRVERDRNGVPSISIGHVGGLSSRPTSYLPATTLPREADVSKVIRMKREFVAQGPQCLVFMDDTYSVSNSSRAQDPLISYVKLYRKT
jgi:hypothetical protein